MGIVVAIMVMCQIRLSLQQQPSEARAVRDRMCSDRSCAKQTGCFDSKVYLV